MPVGRNDPCPCGSGRKFKQCCLAASEIVETRWVAWRRAEGAVVPAVLEFAAEQWGEALIDEAGKTFFLPAASPADEDGYARWEQLFMPWMAFDFVPEPRGRWRSAGRVEWPTTVLALEYARRHAESLAQVEARFISAACEAPLSFMAVAGVQPGRSIDLKDILTGELHVVLERSASSTLRAGNVLLARVVADGDIAVMSGLGPYPLPPDDHNRIIDFREQFLKRRGPLDRAHVKSSVQEVVRLYRQLVDQLLNPAPPRLHNTDGDPLAPTTLVFELRCGVREAVDRLKVLSLALSDDELLADASWSDSGELIRLEFAWSKRGNKLHRDWDNTTLGHLTVSAGEISVFVNSVKRARKIRGLIEKHLGPDVLYLRQTVESMDAVLDHARRHDSGEAQDETPPEFETTPEGQAVIEEFTRRHWEVWLDTKIPVLGDVSPRRAARTALGRERLEALLTEFAWRQETSPRNQIRVDVDWIRQQLGMPRE